MRIRIQPEFLTETVQLTNSFLQISGQARSHDFLFSLARQKCGFRVCTANDTNKQMFMLYFKSFSRRSSVYSQATKPCLERRIVLPFSVFKHRNGKLLFAVLLKHPSMEATWLISPNTGNEIFCKTKKNICSLNYSINYKFGHRDSTCASCIVKSTRTRSIRTSI